MGRKKEVIWFKNSGNLNEVYQSFCMKFSFANIDKDGKIVQCHEWVQCRDYLHDAVRTQLTGNTSHIYGFNFSKEKNPELCTNKMMMLVTNKSIEDPLVFRRNLNNGLKLIHHYENMMGHELSNISKVSGDIDGGYNHVWLITSPKFWLTAPHIVSLYTLLLRCGISKFDLKKHKTVAKALEAAMNSGALSKNDEIYVSNIQNRLEIVIQNHEKLYEVEENGFSKLYYRDCPISSFHSRAGIVSTCSCSTPFEDLNKSLEKHLN